MGLKLTTNNLRKLVLQEIKKLTEHIGAEVSGVDEGTPIATDAAPIDATMSRTTHQRVVLTFARALCL